MDALCILQGTDEEARRDWLHESTLMQRVYSNAVLTILAAASASSDSGLFLNRKSYLPFSIDSNNCNPTTQRYLEISLPTTFKLRAFDDEPVNTRAWILQEQLLSNRILSYCRNDIMWQCKKSTIWEHDYQFSNSIDAHGGSSPRIPPYPMRIDWNAICQNYSHRDLTVPHDKLPALSAAAKEYHLRTNDKYVAGHWESMLPGSLLWAADHFRGFMASGVAPTWSWVSSNGPILFHSLEGENFIARIHSCSTELSTNDPFGMVSGGELVIEVPFRQLTNEEWYGTWLHSHNIRQQLEAEPEKVKATHMLEVIRPGGLGIHFDDEMAARHVSPACIILSDGRKSQDDDLYDLDGDEDRSIRGLLLHKSSKKPGKYTRIGVFEIDRVTNEIFKNSDMFELFEKKIINII